MLDTEVSNRGSQVFGYYFNSAGDIPSTVLVNNVSFTLQASPLAPPGLNFNGSYNHNEAGADLYQVPLTAGNTGLNQILDGQNWGAETPLTVTGLTAGQPYEVQFMTSDDRMGRLNARNYDVGDSNEPEGFRDIERAYHSTRGGGVPAGRPPGSREAKIFTGNFVADASGTQDIYNVLYDGTDHAGANAGSQVNAIQVRLVAPANDNFASAQALSGFAGSVTGTTVGATRQSGEPTHEIFGSSSPTVWFQWTAPGSGSVTFDTGNAATNYDTSVAVYTGNSVTALTFIGANNDQGRDNKTSLVTFNAVSGTTYRIVVLGGSSSASGTFGLDWLQQSPGGALLLDRASLSAFESDGTAKLIVKRVGGSNGPATVAYETVAGTAGPADFVPASGVLSFEDGETSKTITVALTQDTIAEAVEQFRIRLKNATSAALGTPSEALISIFPNLQVPTFRGLGFFPNGFVSRAAAISGNGKVIVGSGDSSTRAFLYDVPTNVLVELDPTRSFSRSGAEAVSADGEVVTGTLFTPSSSPRAFVWDRAGGFRALDLSGALNGQGHGISGDGGLIVGRAKDDGDLAEHPYRWSLNPSSGKYDPEYLPNIWTDDVDEKGREGLAIGAAFAASQTGDIVVGQHQTDLGIEAIRFGSFDAATIGTLGEALGVSAGGETIVGQRRTGNQLEAFRWTAATGVVGLGDLTGGNADSAGKDVSADGTLVVGYGTGSNGREAILWIGNGQMRNIRQALIDAGVNMTGWALNEATGISDDGSTVVGTGVNPGGKTEAWMAVIATPPVITNGGAIGRPGGQSFVFQIQATRSPTAYGASGLPSGLQLNTATGAITGTLPPSGEFVVTLTATNAAGTGTAPLALTIGEPAITSALTAPGAVELPFVYQITASRPAFLSASGLPEGLSVDSAGRISGIPRQEGQFQVTITASNLAGTGSATLNLVIGPPALGFSSETSAFGKVGQAFAYQVVAAQNPQSFSASGLPLGVSINPATGQITGTPTQAGVFDVTIFATNTAGTGNFILNLAIAPATFDAANPENTLGHGLEIVAVSVTAEFGNESVQASFSIRNPSNATSSPGRVEVTVGPSVETVKFAAIPPGGQISISVSVTAQDKGVIYAIVYEDVGSSFVPQDSALLVEFFKYPTGPASGGIVLPEPGQGAPGFNPTRLTRVAIQGPAAIDENTSGQFSARAFFSNGGSFNPQQVQWGTSGPFSISSSGLFNSGALSGNSNATLSASVSYGGVTVSGTKTVTVRDLTPTVTITILDGFAREAGGADTARLRVTRNGSTAEALTVNYAVTGSALPETDYVALSGQLRIPVGNTSADVEVAPIDDNLVEDNETVVVTLFAGGDSYAFGNSSSATVTIIGTISVQFSAATFSVNEAGGTVQIPIARLGDSTDAISVAFALEGESAAIGDDVQLASGRMTIDAGATEGLVTLNIIDDANTEKRETFQVRLTEPSPGVSLGDPVVAKVTIEDDELSSFAQFSGRYHGVVLSKSHQIDSAGFVRLTLTPSGRFTASLKLGGRSHAVKGALDNHGRFLAQEIRGTTFTLALQLNVAEGDAIAFEVANGETVVADGILDRAVFDKRKNFAPETVRGRSTVFLMPKETGPAVPQGIGFGTVNVRADGLLKFVGVLGDATPVSQVVPLSQQLRWPFHVSNRKTGSVTVGTATFSSADGTFTGDFDSFKREMQPPAAYYPGGFTTTVGMESSRYHPPDRGGSIFGVNELELSITGGGLPQRLAWRIESLPVGTKSHLELRGEENLRIKINVNTGTFSGGFTDSDSRNSRRFSGVLSQKNALGFGVFLGQAQETGAVALGSVPGP